MALGFSELPFTSLTWYNFWHWILNWLIYKIHSFVSAFLISHITAHFPLFISQLTLIISNSSFKSIFSDFPLCNSSNQLAIVITLLSFNKSLSQSNSDSRAPDPVFWPLWDSLISLGFVPGTRDATGWARLLLIYQSFPLSQFLLRARWTTSPTLATPRVRC